MSLKHRKNKKPEVCYRCNKVVTDYDGPGIDDPCLCPWCQGYRLMKHGGAWVNVNLYGPGEVVCYLDDGSELLYEDAIALSYSREEYEALARVR